jgi:hypothetical protein
VCCAQNYGEVRATYWPELLVDALRQLEVDQPAGRRTEFVSRAKQMRPTEKTLARFGTACRKIQGSSWHTQ